jgi:hypothetical protein
MTYHSWRPSRTKLRRGLLPIATVAAAVAASLAVVPSALAANCPPPPAVVQPFLQWNDQTDYVPVTNGSFEPITAGSKDLPWVLSGGAATVSDNEPWYVNGRTGDHTALSLPSGSQAVSACTTAPNIASVVRFFVRNTGDPSATLHVEILVNQGKDGILDGGYVSAGSDWAPTNILVLPWAKPLKGAVDLRVRLTPVGAGAAFEVDDVYIDPCKSV